MDERKSDDQKMSASIRTVMIRAIGEATKRSSPAVEAEHILLALAADPRSTSSARLAANGLDYGHIDTALNEERTRSLAIAGVTVGESTIPAPTPRESRPGWSASARDALQRSGRVPHGNRRHRISELDLLVGILRAELGRVPRALALAGIDRDALIHRIQR